MISTIITVFNKSFRFGLCLDSLLWYNRDYPKEKYEIIVVDDGSTDDSFEIAKNTIKDYLPLNFKYIKRPVKDVISNQVLPLNIGFREAVGEIINICVGDVMQTQPTYEIIEKKHLQKFETYYSYDVYNVGPVGMAIGPVLPYIEKYRDWPSQQVFLNTLRGQFGFCDYTSQEQGAMFFFHASIPKIQILRMGGIDERFKEGFAYDDTDFVVRLQKMNYPCSYSKDIISLHLPHPQNEFMSNRINKMNAYLMENTELDGVANKEIGWGINDGKYLIRESV